jgi:hypothetical protein
MKITIERATNGAILTTDYEEPETVKQSMVYCFDDEDEKVGLKGLVDMIYDILQAVGDVGGSKYSRERISVSIIHGSDYECKGCPTCKEDI